MLNPVALYPKSKTGPAKICAGVNLIGKFLITDVQADMIDPSKVRSLREVGVTCKGCGLSSVLTLGNGLHDINGGGVLTCPGCGAHQAVSRQRFEVMLAIKNRPDI